jgi:hypothetical protein
MNANKTLSGTDEAGSMLLPRKRRITGPKLTRSEKHSIRVQSPRFAVITVLLLSAGILARPASAGPFDALKNFFVRPQPQSHVVHHRPAHPKEAKDAPNDNPAQMVSPDQQPNSGPAQNGPNTTNRPGRPAIVAAPLY